MPTYPGFLNSNYTPSPLELPYINDPDGMFGCSMAACLDILPHDAGHLDVSDCQLHADLQERPPAYSCARRFSVLLCTLKAGHIIFVSWDFFINHFGDYLFASVATASIKLTAIESTVIGAIIQVRIGILYPPYLRLSRNWIFLVLTIPTLLLGLAGSLILPPSTDHPRFNPVLLIKNIKLLVPAANMMIACVVICDFFITSFTCWYLLRAKTGFAATNSLISRLLTTAIQSAAPPTICAIINLYFNQIAARTTWVNFFNSLGTKDQDTTRPEVYISRQTHVDGPNRSRTYDSKDGDLYATQTKVVTLTNDDDYDDRASSHHRSVSAV
ncbi:transmembrane protein [Ceratobasidium sp. AG-Ba]|nr:transmembrane protein [Ceratobasidium sp. AG-Ba]